MDDLAKKYPAQSLCSIQPRAEIQIPNISLQLPSSGVMHHILNTRSGSPPNIKKTAREYEVREFIGIYGGLCGSF